MEPSAVAVKAGLDRKEVEATFVGMYEILVPASRRS